MYVFFLLAATMKRTNLTTTPVPDVPTDPVVMPPDNELEKLSRYLFLIFLLCALLLALAVVILVFLKWKKFHITSHNGQTHSQTSTWCPPCKMCCHTLFHSGGYNIVSTAQRSSENSNTDKHLEAGTILHNRPVSQVSRRDFVYETGSLKREENRQSLTNVTFRNIGLSCVDICSLHYIGTNTADSIYPADKSNISLYCVDETNNHGPITNQNIEIDIICIHASRSESSRQSESKVNKFKIDRNEPTLGVHKDPTSITAKDEDVNKKDGIKSSGKCIDGNRSGDAASGKDRDSVRKQDSDRRQVKVKVSQPQGNTNTGRKVTEKNGKPSVDCRESRTKPTNKIPQAGKNSKTGDRKPGDDGSKKDPKASDNRTEDGSKASKNSTAKTGGKGDAMADRNRKYNCTNVTDEKKKEKSSQQNPQSRRAQPANSVNKPGGKTENKKKDTVVMQSTPDAVDPNDDPNRLQIDLFSNVFIPKEEPRTALGDINEYGQVGAAQLERPLHGNEDNDAPLSVHCTERRESQKSPLGLYEMLYSQPPCFANSDL